jgi:hypothetical protein
MENIVAVAVELENGDLRYFLTWGRIQDPVDPKPLEALILDQCHKFALDGRAKSARLCRSLQEAASEPGFYECFFDMCQEKIPFGEDTYPEWRVGMDRQMQSGKQIYYLWHGD